MYTFPLPAPYSTQEMGVIMMKDRATMQIAQTTVRKEDEDLHSENIAANIDGRAPMLQIIAWG